MSESLGQLEAQRILKARDEEAKKRERQIVKRDMLRAQAPLFLEKVGELLKQHVADFNQALDLVGEQAISIQQYENTIDITKTGNPSVLRRIVHYEQEAIVKVKTQTIRGFENRVTEESLAFDVASDGHVILTGSNFSVFAERMFKAVAEAYRPV